MKDAKYPRYAVPKWSNHHYIKLDGEHEYVYGIDSQTREMFNYGRSHVFYANIRNGHWIEIEEHELALRI